MGRPARILFVCSGLVVGGAERQLSILIPAIRKRGFEVSCLTLRDEGPFFDHLVRLGIPTSCAWMRHRADLWGFRRALRLARFEPNIVVTHSINAHVIGHLIAWRASAAHLAMEHSGPDVPRRTYREALARLIGPRLTYAIAVSPVQIPRLIRLGSPRERIRVIPNGVPEPSVSERTSSVRSRLGIGADDFLAVLVATLRPEKRAAIFLRAVQDAHQTNRRIRGLIVGGGPQFGDLRKLANDDRVVQVLGERLDAPDILNAADVACLTSSAEGLPMVLLEAMALGKPVIATDIGGVPEAVQHETTGLLVPVDDERAFARNLLRLAADAALVQRLGRAAAKRQRTHFSVEKMTAEYVHLFQDVLERTERVTRQRSRQ